jgi:hypothetical protein
MTAPISGALERRIMNCNEPRIPREVQISFNKASAQLHRPLKTGQRIFRGVSGRAAMSNHPRFPHAYCYRSRRFRLTALHEFESVTEAIPLCWNAAKSRGFSLMDLTCDDRNSVALLK